MVNFYDKVLSNESTSESISDRVSVTCCKDNPNTGEVRGFNVSCGLGVSCASQCTEKLSHLCPTGNCTRDFEDCIPSYQAEEGEKNQSRSVGDGGDRKRMRRGRFSPANLPSWVFSWCSSRCGRVWRRPICCFNPLCWRMNLKGCKWLQNYSGELYLLMSYYKTRQESRVVT